ncbi:uncharacterized protein LOC115412211 isoform X2 [Sphaeramia orbicularis]|uniref:uncharacterized protein LOC115412211 isoform X2 n=1 Tax=Sphaeramia orbicularis TaxID=375764 RepID=UPI00117DEA66|nr:uncharacterized protein LOC115412211 isoform X2 [Sphaeramia orbicularis]
MKAVILAAGYGTRLQRDVEADSSGQFAHLSGIAKPLLPVGHRALISHWVHALTASGCVDCIYVVGRLGAVTCLQLAVKHFNIEDHIMVIGGDTLFKEDFSLTQVQQRFYEVQAVDEDSCLLLSYQCKDDETSKYGILEVDSNLRVLCMKEKPHPSETKSRRACPCFYMLSKRCLSLLDAFLQEKKDASIEEKDAPGNFVSWLIHRKPVYVHQISGRFDVGNLPSYTECDLYFREKLQDVESYMV